jgi:hypothetical protein
VVSLFGLVESCIAAGFMPPRFCLRRFYAKRFWTRCRPTPSARAPGYAWVGQREAFTFFIPRIVRAKLAKAGLHPFPPSEGLPHPQSLLQKAKLDFTNAEYSTWVFQIFPYPLPQAF